MKNKLRYKSLFLLIALLTSVSVWAQVKVSVQAPSEVIEGDKFRVSYVVNTSNVSDFRIGAFKGLTVLYGPSQSTSSSFSMVMARPPRPVVSRTPTR